MRHNDDLLRDRKTSDIDGLRDYSPSDIDGLRDYRSDVLRDHSPSEIIERAKAQQPEKLEEVTAKRRYWMPGDDYERYDPMTKSVSPVSGDSGSSAQPAARGGIIGKKKTKPVPIITAGGEYIITPDRIKARFGNLDAGHDALDQFVLMVRDKYIKKLKNLEPPRK